METLITVVQVVVIIFVARFFVRLVKGARNRPRLVRGTRNTRPRRVRTRQSAEFRGYLGEIAIQSKLKALDPEIYKVYNDLYVPTEDDKTSQSDHVIISHLGVFVIETKNYSGWILGKGYDKYWTQVIYKQRNRMYSPIWQNNGHIKALAHYLNIDRSKFYSIVAFSDDATLKVDASFDDIDVVHFSEVVDTILKRNVRLLSDEDLIKANVRLEKLDSLSQSDKAILAREHINSVNRTMRERSNG